MKINNNNKIFSKSFSTSHTFNCRNEVENLRNRDRKTEKEKRKEKFFNCIPALWCGSLIRLVSNS